MVSLRAGRRQGQMRADRSARPWTSQVIEVAWLAGLLSVVLAFDDGLRVAFAEQPKQIALHLSAGVIAITWALELALYNERFVSPPSLRMWLGRSPSRWALIAVALFALVAVLSTTFSRAPEVSLWGRDYKHLGYELYSFLSLLILFAAVAVRLRGRDQLQRVVYAFVVSGTLTSAHAVSQHFGWDPIGSGANFSRVWSTQLNPIFFGSFLVMTLPITAIAVMGEAISGRSRGWWSVLAVAVGLQIAALWFTGSRGPIVGASVGAIVLITVAAIKLDRTVLLRALIVWAGGFGLAFVLIATPIGTGRGAGEIVGGFADVGGVGLALTDEDQNVDSGLTGRVGIWRGAIELATSWETHPPESGATSILRPVFGFGPDMYAYAYPLTANARDSIAIKHTHNFLLQILLELGVAGLVTFLAVAFLILAALFQILWPGSSQRPDLWITILAIGLVGALAGRAMEQMGGVARIGDLAPFWILMGLAIALSETIRSGSDSSEVYTRRTRRVKSSTGISLSGLGSWTLVVTVIIVVSGTFIVQDVQQLRGGRTAIHAAHLAQNGDASVALLELQRAIDLAPGVSAYPNMLFNLVRSYAQGDADLASRQALFELGREALIKYSERDPFDIATQQLLALATVKLFEEGREDLRQEVIGRYVNLGQSVPNFYDFQSVVGHGFLIAGDNELALGAANYSISLEQGKTYSWWVRGVALNNLGEHSESMAAFERAIAIRPEDRHSALAHRDYGNLLESLGRLDEAAEHRIRSAEIAAQLNL